MSDSPPGGGTFSLEGRPASGLYLVAWLLSGLGLVMLLVAGLVEPPMRGLLLVGGLAVLVGGLSAGAGYQILARRARPAQAYRGPSPLLLFGLFFVLVNLSGVVLLLLGLADIDRPPAFASVGLLQFALYIVVIWLFVVRSGALRWRDMGLADRAPGRLLGSAAFAAAVMLPATFVALVLGGLVAALLGTRAPDVVPPPQTEAEIVLVVLTAVLLIPIAEEVFFRGYALTAWLRDLGPRSAFVRSTIFFAAIHIANVRADTFEDGLRQALLVLAVVLPVGAVLGWLFMQRGLVAAIAGHVTYNGVLLALLLLTQFLPAPPA